MKSIIECFKKLKKVQIALIIAGIIVSGVAVTFGVLTYMNEYYIEFNVADALHYELEYGAPEELQTVTALYKGTIFNKEGTPVDVTVMGQVDYDRVGTYMLTYVG